jgi:cysteine synthase A
MTIQVNINGKAEEMNSGSTIHDYLVRTALPPGSITVQVNGSVISRSEYITTELCNNDNIEIVFFIEGGSRSEIENSKRKPETKSGQIAADSVLDLVGNTPIVRLNRIVPDNGATIFAKLDYYSPGGSIKDRITLNIIEDAERKGLLKPESVIVEPTSGNTGIGLAMVSAVKGYRCIIIMPESMSLERIYILKTYGAEVILTPAAEDMSGAVRKAEEIARTTPHSFLPLQYSNPANPDMHRRSTAQEIIKALSGPIDAFVAGVGTGGTITGTGEALKTCFPDIRIVAVEPARSAVLSGEKAGQHRIQGIGAGFIPENLNRDIIDEVIKITDEEAWENAQRLAREEGIFCGMTSGANCAAALRVAESMGSDKTIVTVFCDTGDRYFTTQQYFEF